MKRIHSLLFCILLTHLFNAAQAEFNAGGYYKNFFTTYKSTYANDPIMSAVVNRLRFNLSYAPADAFSLNLAYDFAPRVQDSTLFSQSPFAIGVASSKYRISDFDSRLYPSQNEQVGNVGIYHNLDRASMQFSTSFADITIGRDAIAWGSARTINPTDVIAPYTYDQLDTEDRVGVDAIRIRIPVGILGEIDTGYVIGSDFKFNKSAFFLRTQLNAAETDYSVLLLEYQRDLLIGLDITRGIGGAGFWLESAYVFSNMFYDEPTESVNYLRSSIGFDYSFGGETYAFIEYHYNGAGTIKPEDFLENVEQPAYSRGSVYLLGVHYLAPGVTHQITPLISCSGQMLFNLNDTSAWFVSQIGYNIAEDIHISVGGLFNIGKPPKDNDPTQFQSEFGFYPNLVYSSIWIYF